MTKLINKHKYQPYIDEIPGTIIDNMFSAFGINNSHCSKELSFDNSICERTPITIEIPFANAIHSIIVVENKYSDVGNKC